MSLGFKSLSIEDWIHMVQENTNWRALVSTVMHFFIRESVVHFLTDFGNSLAFNNDPD